MAAAFDPIGGSDGPISQDHMLAAKRLAEQLGGIEVARAALASFARLMG
jgi:hypothetical protein